MEYKQRAKMPPSQRAKQFMPFAAVKGLEKAIAEQEQLRNRTEQIELGEEQAQAINEALKHLRKGNMVSVRFHADGKSQALQGKVEQIDPARGTIRIKGIVVPINSILGLAHCPP